MNKINRNSLGQFMRRLGRMIHVSVWFTQEKIKDDNGIEHEFRVRHIQKKPYTVHVPKEHRRVVSKEELDKALNQPH